MKQMPKPFPSLSRAPSQVLLDSACRVFVPLRLPSPRFPRRMPMARGLLQYPVEACVGLSRAVVMQPYIEPSLHILRRGAHRVAGSSKREVASLDRKRSFEAQHMGWIAHRRRTTLLPRWQSQPLSRNGMADLSIPNHSKRFLSKGLVGLFESRIRGPDL